MAGPNQPDPRRAKRLRRLLPGGKGHRARLDRAAVQAAEDRTWAIVYPVYDLLARAPFEELSRHQRVAQLALFYSNAIENDGHLAYFRSQGRRRAFALLRALQAIGARGQRAIFMRALAKAVKRPVEQAGSPEGHCEHAGEQEFRDEDDAFHACEPRISDVLLPGYIMTNLDHFAEYGPA